MTTLSAAKSAYPAISPLPAPSATPRKQLVMNWVVNGKLECRWIEA
ncbi:MAG: hypothetical protein IGS48_05295 [Oscillatoriales cyanobacterium C42_A2020_001]|nr:hypothetical protein [Leptolyngbyaceae cyanobacterium C42_A2020_001]